MDESRGTMKQSPAHPAVAGRTDTSRVSFVDVIDEQRTEIGKAMSIVEACRLGSDSMLAPMPGREGGEPDFEGALAAAWSILNNASTMLEQIMRELQKEKRGTP